MEPSEHSVAKVKHGMEAIMKATKLVNPAQIPVLTLDQPLYTIAKQIKWTWSSIYGEEKYVVLMGGLHIEIALLNVLGDWLEGSGWASIMASAWVTTEGRADALQSGLHTSRAQWAHPVAAAAAAASSQQQQPAASSSSQQQPPAASRSSSQQPAAAASSQQQLPAASRSSQQQQQQQPAAAALFCLQSEAFLAYKDNLEVRNSNKVI